MSAPQPSQKDNFFLHVNHKWLQENSIPPSEASWGTFHILDHQTRERLKKICEEAQEHKDAAKGSGIQLVRDFYHSGMDMDSRNKKGTEPVKHFLWDIEQMKNSQDAIRTLATLHKSGITPFFSPFVYEDFKKADFTAFFIEQSGLGMPNRDYYLKDDENMREKRKKYREHIANIFELYEKKQIEGDEKTNSVMRVELALAEASVSAEEERELDKNYHKFSKEKAKEAFPDVDWDTYFQQLGVSDITDFVIMQPKFVSKTGELLQKSDLKDIKNYLTFTVLNSTAGLLSEEFVSENFKFNGQVIQGLKEQKPLWKQTVQQINSGPLTNAIGALYCEKYFKSEDKIRVMEMVGHVKESFIKRVKDLDWMTDQTKKLTLEKLANITFKMGFPDTWIDVSNVDIKSDSYAENNLHLAEFEFKRKLNQLNKPYDRTEWHMPPTIVNASADLKREMTFPAAILQPPFFDSSADEAYNYGAIGMVIGHELTHFFDDQGSKFDVQGNMNTWWSEEDTKKFKEKARKFVEHFNKYKANGIQVNGQLTLGENIADVAGMAIAYDAYQKYLDKHPGNTVDGLTPEQRFFVGYARVWAIKVTPERAQQLALIDPHAPGEVRVNAVLSVTPPFLKAFDIQEGDQMYTPPADHPKLW